MTSLNQKAAPKKIRRFLEGFYGEGIVEDLIGDAEEIYFNELKSGKPSAKWNYNRHLISLFFSYGLKRRIRIYKNKFPESNNYNMHKSYFTVALRSLLKNKLFSAIRLGNLIIGIAVSLLCWIYVRYEISYEKFFANSTNIYRLQHETPEKLWAATPRAAGVYAYENFPAVKSMVRFSPSSTLVRKDDKVFMEDGILFSDSTVFDVFSYQFISGDPKSALTQPLSTVLTESSAIKYFGTTDVLGKQITFEFDRGEPREITGVIKDPPTNSHIQFDFLTSIYAENPNYNRSWSNWGTYAYLLMEPDADFKTIGDKIEAEYRAHYQIPEEIFFVTAFVPLEDIHLYSNAEKEFSINANANYLYIFSFAGLFVLIISILNFTNLTLAKSMDRSKEVGLRKSIGASKKTLIVQFLLESYIQVFISVLAAVGLVYFILPFFRSLSALPLPFPITSPSVFLPLLSLAILIGIICGLYPALIISNFKATEMLKSSLNTSKMRTGGARRILSIVQFAISAILIIGSIFIYKQSQFIKNRDLGFNKDQVLKTDLNYSMNLKLDAFESELRRIPGVKEVAHSSSIPGYRIMREPQVDISSGVQSTNRLLLASETFIETFDLEIIEGRTFTKNPNLEKSEWIMNEEAVKVYSEGNDVSMLGRMISWGRDTAEVVGVVKNFNFETLHEEVGPLMILRRPNSSRYLSIRFDSERTSEVLSAINKMYKDVYPNLPDAEFEFLSDHFASLYNAESRLQFLVFIFCSISLLLTISGIYALTVHFTQKKTKEIAIRKVLGSSISSVILLVMKHFLFMVLISLIISIPASYYLSGWWLQQFAYKINVEVLTFLIGGLSILFIVVLSASYTTVKAASTNPVRWLRNE